MMAQRVNAAGMEHTTRQNILRPELYFLLQKFLAQSPLQETYKVLCRELEASNILPSRLDWEGNTHERSFSDLERLYPHIGSDHLLEICSRIGPILDKEIPPTVKGVCSLLGSGRQSLLRTPELCIFRKLLQYYATRKHGMPICDPHLVNATHNITSILVGREMSGPIPRIIAMPTTRYSHLQMQRQTLGHLSAVYCLLFDHTGRYIITGADDLLVKLWSAYSGRLLASFRGASSEITDIDINLENTLLAAGSIDRILRVWDLQTAAPVAILTCHTGMITSVHFCPSARWDLRYLVTTSSDGSVAFWTYSHDTRDRAQFVSKPILYQEKMRPGQAQMICSAFSPGGGFLAAGSADHHVRVYLMRGDEGPIRILETEVHTDRVDSIVWAHRGLRFVSGGKDGTAYIWHFERQQWKSNKLCMSTKLPTGKKEEEDTKKLVVTMVAWDYSDNYIITAVSDHCLKVWRSGTGELVHVLTGHTDGIFVLESHPKDPYIALSTGHDGQVFIWDVHRGKHVAHFTNSLDNGQGLGAVFDAKWSPDGSMFAASDSHGHIMIYGFGNGNPCFKMLPKELFFHTDYRPLMRDADHLVLDEQTQIPPHMMPPPFLVDIDGNPYPPMLQRLVPGREHCTSEQLVPNIVIGTGGRQEVIQGLDQGAPRSDIDRMIAALAHRQYGPNDNDADAETESNGSNAATSPRSIRNGPRRGDIEGVRQSTGDWQRDPNIVWSKNVLVQPLGRADLVSARELVENVCSMEIAEYQKEIKRRPLMINTASSSGTLCNDRSKRRRANGVPTRRTRSNHTAQPESEAQQDGEGENEESNASTSEHSDDSSAKEEDLVLSESSSDSDESSGYSDWVADQGVNLEPPKRSKRKSAHRKVIIDRDDDDDDDEVVKNSAATSSSSKPKVVVTPPVIKNGEIPEIYKALEWLSETIPRKAPYCPQMGDEVVYFVQGHRMYVDAVKMKKVYNVNSRDLPWTKHKLRDHEYVKIVGIKYEIRPPRLCCLKLALLDEEHRLTENVFTIKYHDMADVLDFFVLKQTYETAISRAWVQNDKFRCMIDDGWWLGKIVLKKALSEDYPDSLFMCYEIQWDNGEFERMSPWDLEPIREDRIPESIGEAVLVLPDEIQSILYQPTIEEWPRGDRDACCRRIIAGLDKVMALAIAEPFLAPVDFNLYPSYAYIVEYPVDISTIKARFENHFYRRITSAQFDVRYLATNAEKFNKPHSIIVKHARIITDLCLKIIKNCTEDIDVTSIYHQLMDTYESSCSEEDAEVDVVEPGPSTRLNNRSLRIINTRNNSNIGDWRVAAKKLLDDLWSCEDSVPFRLPVDRIKHPEYYQIIDTPMDLGTVREDLFGGNYECPQDFAKDMRLIFQNSKNYNTNKRSRIYSMTVRLSAKFEKQMSSIIFHWKKSKNKGITIRKSSRRKPPAKTPVDSDSDNSEKENKEEYKRTRNHVTRYNNKRNAPSTSNKEDSDSSSSSSSDESEIKKVESPQEVEEEDDEDEIHVSPDENNRASPPAKLSHSSNSNYSDQSEHITNNRTRKFLSNSSDTDESDYEPLSKYRDNTRTSSNHKRKNKLTSSSDSDSDSGIRKNLRPRNSKRRRCLTDSDSDNLPLKHYERDSDEDSESDRRIVTISSRGRVRKLTERARALLKKSN